MANKTIDLLSLSLSPGLYANRRIEEEAKKAKLKFLHIDPLSITLALSGKNLIASQHLTSEKIPKVNRLWTRMTLSHLFHIAEVANYFEIQGAKPINQSQALVRISNKWQCYKDLALSGIPVPVSTLSSELTDTKTLIENPWIPKHERILKSIQGTQGKGVHLASNKTLSSSLDLFKMTNTSFLQQEFLQGKIQRSLILNDEFLGAIELSPSIQDFRSNFHQGGKSTQIASSRQLEKLRELSFQVQKICHLSFFAIDFIKTGNQLFVLDVNGNPGFESFEISSKINVAKKVVSSCLQA